MSTLKVFLVRVPGPSLMVGTKHKFRDELTIVSFGQVWTCNLVGFGRELFLMALTEQILVE